MCVAFLGRNEYVVTLWSDECRGGRRFRAGGGPRDSTKSDIRPVGW